MKYQASISVQGDPDKLHECLAAEHTDFDRSEFTIKKTETGLEIDIQAKDSTALRATLNSFTQLLTVYDKMEGLK